MYLETADPRSQERVPEYPAGGQASWRQSDEPHGIIGRDIVTRVAKRIMGATKYIILTMQTPYEVIQLLVEQRMKWITLSVQKFSSSWVQFCF